MELITLPGGPALSDFRLRRLSRSLGRTCPAVAGVAAHFLYIAAFHHAPSGEEVNQLARLLGDVRDILPGEAGRRLFVLPRLGTVSPWSSRASDIAAVCGLEGVHRLERGCVYELRCSEMVAEATWRALHTQLHDPMTEVVLEDEARVSRIFQDQPPRPLRQVDVLGGGRGEGGYAALREAGTEWGMALSADELTYLLNQFRDLNRNPTDAELMTFAQINSEHCRHKIFNARWRLDGRPVPHTLFGMIKQSHVRSPDGVLSAYSDNAAVIAGRCSEMLLPDASGRYRSVAEPAHILIKVETHNHPTAISPFAGAATGAGGEIRDEAATGRGGRAKAGLCGFSVSNLNLPGARRPWEQDHTRPSRVVSALDIMLEGPIGAARYNNEFGRPNLSGYFRTLEAQVADSRGRQCTRAYHKPIMIAGGLGNVRPEHVHKAALAGGAQLIVLGGPAMLIGLGGGAASSMGSGDSSETLDFASVQRANPEMERRCQQVIDTCCALGDANPIVSIHDVGAGGLSNAVPELLHPDGLGADMELRRIPSADAALSPMEIWCNEAQERYVLAIGRTQLETFSAICQRERCPFAVVGEATVDTTLRVRDAAGGACPIELPISVLLGASPKLQRDACHTGSKAAALDLSGIEAEEALERVLRLPAVADKSFLITIGDRTVGGLVARDQMVGPWQVPVSDVAVTAGGFTGVSGEAMAMGERAPIALVDAPASGRMAVAEALTNIAAADVDDLSDVRLSANWMAAAGDADQDACLFDTVRAVGAELCPALGIAIPVGKDSLSMKSIWNDGAVQHEAIAPLSLIISAFAPVANVARTLTPELRRDRGHSALVLLAPGARLRLGGSALAQVFSQAGDETPDVDDPAALRRWFAFVRQQISSQRVWAYHDRSDGGLIVTLLEMAFAAHVGLDIQLGNLGDDALAALFAEELGAVVQVAASQIEALTEAASQAGLLAAEVAQPRLSDQQVHVRHGDQMLLQRDRPSLQRIWSETTFQLQSLRDEPECAQEAFDALLDASDTGLNASLSFDPQHDVSAPFVHNARPRVAILREQGVNGHREMAFAFHRAGFEAVDVHMTDLVEKRFDLSGFQGLAACGGFSYGDVLGAGQGWAKSVLMRSALRDMFAAFLARDDRFALGVCNGCQMLAALAELIPGADDWPRFIDNRSAQFEARQSLVEIASNRSLLFAGMAGSWLPIAVAHGEGRALFVDGEAAIMRLAERNQIALRYVTPQGSPASRYPYNPNGSPAGITGLCNADGRITIMMPHPERVIRTLANSWHPDDWGKDGPWLRLFRNARRWVG